MISYDVRRGATARFIIKDTSSGDLEGWTCTGALRRLAPGAGRLAGNEPVAATYTVSSISAGQGKGWHLELSAETTALLQPGAYLSDARITMPGGEATVTESWNVHVVEPATLP